MRQSLLVIASFSIVPCLHAQKGIDGLIKAEERFAAYSVAHNTRDAFLDFLDSAGIVFNNGQAVNGIRDWSARPKNAAILDWHPEFAEVAASQDFGYTTGPWTYRGSAKDSIAASGRYITVWHINNEGQWKFLADLGVGRITPGSISSLQKIRLATTGSAGTEASLLDAEKSFIAEVSHSAKAGYQQFLSKNSIINRNGQSPLINAQWNDNLAFPLPEKITYTVVGSGIASTGDLGYVYGTTLINAIPENYLRIWRKEEDGWKIAVEVLRY